MPRQPFRSLLLLGVPRRATTTRAAARLTETAADYTYIPNGSGIYNNQDDDLPSSDYVKMQLDTWYEVQMRVKQSAPGASDGALEYWIDGTQYFGLYDIDNDKGSVVEGIDYVELQHVYETGSPKTGPVADMPSYMKNIVIATAYIESNLD